MTLRAEGKIGGREFAIRSDGKRWVCLGCLRETKPDREAFERHECDAAAQQAKAETSTSRKRSAAQTSTPTTDGEK